MFGLIRFPFRLIVDVGDFLARQLHRETLPQDAAFRRRQFDVLLLGVLLLLPPSAVLAQDYQFQGQIAVTLPASGIAIDPGNQHLVITSGDATQAAQILNFQGNVLDSFIVRIANPFTGRGTPGVAVDPVSHDIYVTDFSGPDVETYDPSGNHLGEFGSFVFPYGVAVDPASGRIVVTDSFVNTLEAVPNAVQVFDSLDARLEQFGRLGSGNGEIAQATFVAIDPTTKNIVVADSGNDRVEIFDTSGNYLSQFGSQGTQNGQFVQPRGVAIDPVTSDIFVADSGNSRVEIFSPAGVYLNQFGTNGSGAGQFIFPAGVAIDPTTRNVFVADSGNERLQIFAPNAATLANIAATVVEFYDANDDLYFITANPAEAAIVHSGADNLGPSTWGATNETFNAYTGPGPGSDVCRFYNADIPPVGIHFYTALPVECANIQATLPAWHFETGNAFNIPLPVNGTCASGLTPVTRYFDQRVDESWRFTTDTTVDAAMLAKGWVNEGVQMCAPQWSSRQSWRPKKALA